MAHYNGQSTGGKTYRKQFSAKTISKLAVATESRSLFLIAPARVE